MQNRVYTTIHLAPKACFLLFYMDVLLDQNKSMRIVKKRLLGLSRYYVALKVLWPLHMQSCVTDHHFAQECFQTI